jgi:regulator of nucleoside diphosphate kinase
MNRLQLVVSKQDRWRLMESIAAARRSWRTFGPHLDWLSAQLQEAHAFEPAELPPDVVSMNSRVEVEDLRSGQGESFTLVYPGDEEAGTDKVSVFQPAGLALLGSRVGDVVAWQDAGRSRTVCVGGLRYQPEAVGDLHL